MKQFPQFKVFESYASLMKPIKDAIAYSGTGLAEIAELDSAALPLRSAALGLRANG